MTDPHAEPETKSTLAIHTFVVPPRSNQIEMRQNILIKHTPVSIVICYHPVHLLTIDHPRD